MILFSSFTFFLFLVPILAVLLIVVNFILAPYKPNAEKRSPFECGFHSFREQSRRQFTIAFFIVTIIFMLFDIEIFSVIPYTKTSEWNDLPGLIFMLVFLGVLTVGFVFEIGKNALSITSRQTSSINDTVSKSVTVFSVQNKT
jgi:NADH-ubiquinone oxidoreductase chain 3